MPPGFNAKRIAASSHASEHVRHVTPVRARHAFSIAGRSGEGTRAGRAGSLIPATEQPVRKRLRVTRITLGSLLST